MDADAVAGAVAATAGHSSRPELAILSGLVVTLFTGFSGLLLAVLRMWRDSVRDQGKECREAVDAIAAEVRRLAERIG